MNSRNFNSLYLCPALVHNCLTLSLEYAHAHKSLAREAVRKSLVLLKNGKIGDAPLLPLNRDAKKVLVVGAHANDIGLQCGGWTISWHGKAGNTTPGEPTYGGQKFH
jgi:beta-glucosidase-like glycosyl hydrolase